MIRRVFALVLGVVSCLSVSPAQSPNSSSFHQTIPPTEREALVALFAATDGAHWKDHTAWMGPSGTECHWSGVRCHPGADGVWGVSNLEVSENNLKGYIPNELTQLSHLEVLSLFGNHLSGKIPDPLIRLSLAGSLSINAEAALLTDVSSIDFEVDPTYLLCGRERIIMSVAENGYWVRLTIYRKRCRNSTLKDRTTFCEVKQDRLAPEYFANLAWLLDKNGFYSLQKDYSRGIIDATPFVQTRVKRDSKTYEVVDWGGAPFDLWVIERAIESTVADSDWMSMTRQPKCPMWKDGEVKQSTARK